MEKKCLVDGLAQGLGMESVGDYSHDRSRLYGDEDLLDLEDLVPFSQEVMEAHLAAMTEVLGPIPKFNYDIKTVNEPNKFWKCWLSGNGADFTHAFNLAKTPYNQKKIPKAGVVNSVCHEVTHAVGFTLRLKGILDGKRPLSDMGHWSTDPFQFIDEAMAHTSPLWFETEFTNNPVVVFNCAYYLLLNMIRNNVQMYNAAGTEIEQVDHFVNSFAEGRLFASSKTVCDRNHQGPIHQISPFLYALGDYMFAAIHRAGSAQDKKDLLRMSLQEPCTYEHLRQRFGPWHSPHCMAPDTDLAL